MTAAVGTLEMIKIARNIVFISNPATFWVTFEVWTKTRSPAVQW